jgi:HEAT repeat protein
MKQIIPLCLVLLAGCGSSTAHWIEQMKSDDPRTRLHAVHALYERTGQREVVLPALLEALQDPNPYVRRDAAKVLEKFDPPAQEAVPALLALLKDGVPSVRKTAGETLQKIDPGAAARAGVR